MNKIQFRKTSTEVTVDMALELFSKKEKLYAYDEKNDKEYRIRNKRDLNDALRDEHILFINNLKH